MPNAFNAYFQNYNKYPVCCARKVCEISFYKLLYFFRKPKKVGDEAICTNMDFILRSC